MSAIRSAQFTGTVMSDVTTIRRRVVEYLGASLGSAATCDAGVMTTELVSNVFLHTSSTAVVCVDVDRTSVQVTVHDLDGGSPAMQPLDATRVGGNGLRIVDGLAETWGTIADPGRGKSVWFRLLR